MKLQVLDTYYCAALAAFRWQSNRYAEMLRDLLDYSFGTSDFVSESMRERGWEAEDLVVNCDQLQRAWQIEAGLTTAADLLTNREVSLQQVAHFKPDILFLQDASWFSSADLAQLRQAGVRKIVAQVSCPMPPEENLKALDLVFTSFPHYRAREFPRMGVRSVFHRLAFSPLACARAGGRVPDRDIPVSFVGGLGGGAVGRGWWDRGTQALARLAEQGGLHWYGYGRENWNANCSLNGCWKGEAWGVDMYRIYLRSRIVVNRHGEVAEGSGNNMRQYEATGCGACLVTDEPGVFADGQECAVYRRPEDLPGLVAELLRDEPRRQRIAEAGHRATMGLHTYDVRAEALDEELRGLLGGS